VRPEGEAPTATRFTPTRPPASRGYQSPGSRHRVRMGLDVCYGLLTAEILSTAPRDGSDRIDRVGLTGPKDQDVADLGAKHSRT